MRKSSKEGTPEVPKELARTVTEADLKVDVINVAGKDLKVDEIRSKIPDLRKRIDEGFWELSELLFHVWEKELWKRWANPEGVSYASFYVYVEQELEFKERKAQYLIRIWNWFGRTLAAHLEIQEQVKQLGWAKAKELEGILTPDNWETWIEKAKTLSTVKLIEDVKEYRKTLEGGESDGSSGGSKGKGGSTEEKLARKVFHLYPEQEQNVEEALRLAGSKAQSEKDGHLIDMICVAYIAGEAEPSTRDVLGLLERIEMAYGIRILAAKKDSMSLVHGKEMWKEIEAAIESKVRTKMLQKGSGGE